MGFLSDALAADTSITSTFTECIVVATISGRALSHRNQCLAGDLYFSAVDDFWNRHQWINAILTQRMEAFSAKYPLDMQQQTDPMLLFISLMWRTIILHLYQTMACVIPSHDDKRDLVTEYKKRSSAAAQEIVDLTNKLSHLNSLKVSAPNALHIYFSVLVLISALLSPGAPSNAHSSFALCRVLDPVSQAWRRLYEATSGYHRGHAESEEIQ